MYIVPLITKMKKLARHTFLTFYLINSLLLLIEWYSSDWQFLGYWTPKIIGWSWLISTLILIVVFWQKRWVKFYGALLLSMVGLSILPMAIPFFGLILFFSTIDDYQQITLNDTYRLEVTRHSVLSMPRVYIYQKQSALFEKNTHRPFFGDIAETILEPKTYDERLQIDDLPPYLDNARFVNENTDGIFVEYEFQGRKKVIFHPFGENDGY